MVRALRRRFGLGAGGPLLDANSKFRFKTLRFYFEPEIVTFKPNRMLIWSAKGPAGTSGAHAWYIESTPGGCRVITEEAQRGLLLFFLRSRTRGTLLTSHQEWLRALKELPKRGSRRTHGPYETRPSKSCRGGDARHKAGHDGRGKLIDFVARLPYITGMVKLAPSLTPEGQRAVTVFVLV